MVDLSVMQPGRRDDAPHRHVPVRLPWTGRHVATSVGLSA